MRSESTRHSRRAAGDGARPIRPWGLAVAGTLLAASLLPACRSRMEAENDRLRAENLELKKQVSSLTASNSEWSAKLNEAARARDAAMDPEVLAALPRISSIELDSLSGLFPGDRAKPASSVVVYIRPLDGRRRFTQGVGRLSVEARLLPPSLGTGDGPAESRPEMVLQKELTPAQMRDAYRSGVTGTHYEIELPLDKPMADRRWTILLRAQFADAITGEVFTTEHVVD